MSDKTVISVISEKSFSNNNISIMYKTNVSDKFSIMCRTIVPKSNSFIVNFAMLGKCQGFAKAKNFNMYKTIISAISSKSISDSGIVNSAVVKPTNFNMQKTIISSISSIEVDGNKMADISFAPKHEFPREFRALPACFDLSPA